jgi:hypothetical protein
VAIAVPEWVFSTGCPICLNSPLSGAVAEEVAIAFCGARWFKMFRTQVPSGNFESGIEPN